MGQTEIGAVGLQDVQFLDVYSAVQKQRLQNAY
jgi:hypothetical protein